MLHRLFLAAVSRNKTGKLYADWRQHCSCATNSHSLTAGVVNGSELTVVNVGNDSDAMLFHESNPFCI
jgi:hypothetical protein